jgi:hypothetical protein
MNQAPATDRQITTRSYQRAGMPIASGMPATETQPLTDREFYARHSP